MLIFFFQISEIFIFLPFLLVFKEKGKSYTDLIFVTNITNIISGEKIAMWRIFSFPCMTIAGKSKISLHVEKFQMSSHDRCGKIWNSPHLACVWCRKRRHICKIYAIFLKNQFCQNLRTLSRNPFCRNLRTFVWRKIYPKIFYVEKKWQIWGLFALPQFSISHV